MSSMRRYISVWLLTGIILVFFQILIGGVTRLTGSGLSITKWEIVTGTLPPLSTESWEREFSLYKETPQYKKLNKGMNLSSFKFIYFWEYFHRVWARMMGLIFIIPFFFFLYKDVLDRSLKFKLFWIIPWAGIVASFGWIMVKSGLSNRPFVNAYKLTMHLSLALSLFLYLIYIWINYNWSNIRLINNRKAFLWLSILFGAVCLQIGLGGLLSGSKAALNYPTWPLMDGGFFPEVIQDKSSWTVDNFLNYDGHLFFSGLIQFIHRSLAYLLVISLLYFVWDMKDVWQQKRIQWFPTLLVTVLISQVFLGIFTLLQSKSSIPVALGVMHQGVAIVLLSLLFFGLMHSRSIES